MINSRCLLCGNKENLTELYPSTYDASHLNKQIYSARRLPDKIHYRIVKCVNCGLIFSSPILPPGKISKLYQKSGCTYSSQVNHIAETYLKLFDRVKDFLPEKPEILEVGCGDGFFLKALYDRGVKNVHGVEPGVEMVKAAYREVRKNIKTDIFRKGQFSKNRFDLVCCFHTLDHLTDPELFVKESFNILKPGGIVLIVTHDTEGLSVKLFGERSPIFDIEHIYLFNKKTIASLFENNGFTTVSSADLVNTYPLSYWLRMGGINSDLKNFGQKILTVTGLGNINLSLAGGNLVYTGKK
jgi:SAM-dependent methyltransferase